MIGIGIVCKKGEYLKWKIYNFRWIILNCSLHCQFKNFFFISKVIQGAESSTPMKLHGSGVNFLFFPMDLEGFSVKPEEVLTFA